MKRGSDIEGKRVLVVGLGYRTGLAAANFLAARGARVTVSDSKSAEALRDVADRLDRRVAVRAGEQGPSLLDEGADMVVLSPGVPASIPLITEARRRGIPVTGGGRARLTVHARADRGHHRHRRQIHHDEPWRDTSSRRWASTPAWAGT